MKLLDIDKPGRLAATGAITQPARRGLMRLHDYSRRGAITIFCAGWIAGAVTLEALATLAAWLVP